MLSHNPVTFVTFDRKSCPKLNRLAMRIRDTDPFVLFAEWFAEAKVSEPNDPEAMALASATPDGAPSVRMVLLKGHDPRGFVFYTNLQSRKGGELAANPQAALLFHWKSLRRQVRIEGPVEPVSTPRPTPTSPRAVADRRSDRRLPTSRDRWPRGTYISTASPLWKPRSARAGAAPAALVGLSPGPHGDRVLDRPRLSPPRTPPLRPGVGRGWTSGLLYP